MLRFEIDATKSTPRIYFDQGKNVLEIKGESYPENTSEFYGPFFKWLDMRLEQLHEENFTVDIALIYFNSSSSKILMNLFERLEKYAERGKNIAVNWIYDKNDESSLEYGEEFEEDLTTLKFNLVEKAGG
ncbi:DUF1987 domain-containing protein [Candidatus Magnetominusculus dajiuhuensis]|uniref:DUF1987 domain-containing protein n=1 Tax=Candidatus Magnetominusculus dajiuhuensis TaxID=3137712 RepID=UPI003B430AC8